MLTVAKAEFDRRYAEEKRTFDSLTNPEHSSIAGDGTSTGPISSAGTPAAAANPAGNGTPRIRIKSRAAVAAATTAASRASPPDDDEGDSDDSE